MLTREPYTLLETTIKNSLQAICLFYRTGVRRELFEEEIDDLKSTLESIIDYTLFQYKDVCELVNYVSNLIRDPVNGGLGIQVFLKNIYNDLEKVKIGLKYAISTQYDA